MPLLSEILGALVAGALLIVVLRQLGLDSRRAFGGVALVAIVAATLLAAPALRQDVSDLLHQRGEYAELTSARAQIAQGAEYHLNTAFVNWVGEHIGEGQTFQLEIGQVRGETTFEGQGVLEAATLAWATYQLLPDLPVEGTTGSDAKSGDGEVADWIVFYRKDPKEYDGRLGRLITYRPNYAIARNADAG